MISYTCQTRNKLRVVFVVRSGRPYKIGHH